MAYNYHGSQGDTSSIAERDRSMGYGNNERDRLQDNLAKAFSLLDDDKPKSPYIPDHRIGTAPAGYGAALNRSNYTGSDMGDSVEMDRRHVAGYGVPNLGLQ